MRLLLLTERDSSICNPSSSSLQGLVGDAAMRKALPCVFGVSWVCNALRQPAAQHCLQMQINFPHTSASNKLRRQIVWAGERPVLTFCSSIWREKEASCKKISFVCEREVLLEILLINLKREEEVRCRWLSLSLQINLRSRLTHRMNGNLKVPLLNTSISSLNKLRRLQQKTEEKLAVCKLIKPCSSSNPSGISYHLPSSHFHLNTILFGLSKELLSDSTHLPAILSYVVELF